MNSDFISKYDMGIHCSLFYEYIFPFFYDSNYCIEINERI